MTPNVKITAINKQFQDGSMGYEVLVDGMNGNLNCKKSFREPLKAMRYMFFLSKRLDLRIDSIQLCALSLAYQRAKDAMDKVVEEANETAASQPDDNSEPTEEKSSVEEVKEDATGLTPMQKQFYDLKAKHPDAILLLRCGDFYETYNEDAHACADILGITLTRSSKTKNPDGSSLEMAGFPHHALDTYLPKLIRAGRRVAICDQLGNVTKKRATKKMQDMFEKESA